MTQTKRDLIVQILQGTGALSLGANLRTYITLTTSDQEELRAKYLGKADDSAVIELIVPFYDEAFTELELSEFDTFMQSPIGVKMMKVSPELNANVLKACQEWGNAIVKDLMGELPPPTQADIEKAMKEMALCHGVPDGPQNGTEQEGHQKCQEGCNHDHPDKAQSTADLVLVK
jgi:hypothetical protein